MNRKTNSKSGLSLNKGSGQANNLPESVKTTPTRDNNLIEEDSFNSPIFSQYSQEEYEFCDVIWNWNSAQVKPRPRKHKKIEFVESPKLTIKRHPSNNQITDFKRLQEELEGLTCDFFTNNSNSKQDLSSDTSKPLVELENIFDDSMEDQLIICSQEIEKRIDMNTFERVELEGFAKQNGNILPTSLHGVTDLALNSADMNKNMTNTLTYLDDELEHVNDTFDYCFREMQDQNIKLCSQNREFDNIQPTNIDKIITDKTTTIDEEIERKRQEALRKLKSKTQRAQGSTEKDSPMKCSPEEIEQKRLQALAKLQTKRKLVMIERNRLEAIKRLEFNKKKRAE